MDIIAAIIAARSKLFTMFSTKLDKDEKYFIKCILSSFDRKIIPDTGNPDNPESYEGGEVDAKSQSRHTGVG